jgi:hypothetical protein
MVGACFQHAIELTSPQEMPCRDVKRIRACSGGDGRMPHSATPGRDLGPLVRLLAERVAARILAGTAANDAHNEEVGRDEKSSHLRSLFDGQAKPDVD